VLISCWNLPPRHSSRRFPTISSGDCDGSILAAICSYHCVVTDRSCPQISTRRPMLSLCALRLLLLATYQLVIKAPTIPPIKALPMLSADVPKVPIRLVWPPRRLGGGPDCKLAGFDGSLTSDAFCREAARVGDRLRRLRHRADNGHRLLPGQARDPMAWSRRHVRV
jgi:hypothetical protein